MVVDRDLSRRLERAEGLACSAFVEARSRRSPESGAEWIDVNGTYAMYDGAKSPITQTFGLGLFHPAAAGDLERIEEFYRARGAPVFHEVSPLADKSLLELLCDRGYRPVELTSVMFLPLVESARPAQLRNEAIRVRIVSEEEHEIWARTAAEGWRDAVELSDSILELLRVTAGRLDVLSFLAELNDQPVAAGVLCIRNGVALLGGASTIPEARKQGAQRALLESRLRHAAETGCDLAMMCAEPGSASQRNAERQGFRIAYTRIKWGLMRGPYHEGS